MPISENRKIYIENKVKEFNSEIEDIPINIVLLARKNGFVVQRLNLDRKTFGILLYSHYDNLAGLDTRKLIVVKSGLSEEQSRYILAHELGYYRLFSKENIIAHKMYDGFFDNPKEQEADYFAQVLLMPSESVKNFIDDNSNKESSDEDIISKISLKYNVSKNLAVKRFYEILPKTSRQK